MSPRSVPPLPPGPVSLATARALGLADHDWRVDDLRRVTQSVRSVQALSTVPERARAFALALPPDCAFSHVTAAMVWGLPLPARLEGQTLLDVMRDSTRGRIERKGCRSHRGLESRAVEVVDGLRTTSLADTWVDLGEVTTPPMGREDLVVAGDAAVSRWVPAEVERGPGSAASAAGPLRRSLESRSRPRGKGVLSAALDLVRPGVRSPMESRARLMFVDARFPEPEVNAPIVAAEGGWLAEGDLVWRRQSVVCEYQGAVHADIRARSDDAYRSGLLVDEGWTVIELFADDITREHRRRAVLQRTARALGLDPRRLLLR